MGRSAGATCVPSDVVMRRRCTTLGSSIGEMFVPGGTPSILANARFGVMRLHSASSAMPMPIGASSNSVAKSRARCSAARRSTRTCSWALTNSSERRTASAIASTAAARARSSRPASRVDQTATTANTA